MKFDEIALEMDQMEAELNHMMIFASGKFDFSEEVRDRSHIKWYED